MSLWGWQTEFVKIHFNITHIFDKNIIRTRSRINPFPAYLASYKSCSALSLPAYDSLLTKKLFLVLKFHPLGRGYMSHSSCDDACYVYNFIYIIPVPHIIMSPLSCKTTILSYTLPSTYYPKNKNEIIFFTKMSRKQISLNNEDLQWASVTSEA